MQNLYSQVYVCSRYSGFGGTVTVLGIGLAETDLQLRKDLPSHGKASEKPVHDQNEWQRLQAQPLVQRYTREPRVNVDES